MYYAGFRETRPLWHLDKQTLRLTNQRIFGRTEHRSANRFTSFSIPYTQIENIEATGFLRLALDVHVRGVRKPLRFYLVDDRTVGDRWDVAVNHANDPEALERAGVAPVAGLAQIDRAGSEGGGRGIVIGVALVLLAVVVVAGWFFVAQPLFALHARYGSPDSFCVTTARLYRDNLRDGLGVLVERYDTVPERQIQRSVLISLASRAMAGAYHDQAFSRFDEGACLRRMFEHMLDEDATHAEIADAIEAEVLELMGAG